MSLSKKSSHPAWKQNSKVGYIDLYSSLSSYDLSPASPVCTWCSHHFKNSRSPQEANLHFNTLHTLYSLFGKSTYLYLLWFWLNSDITFFPKNPLMTSNLLWNPSHQLPHLSGKLSFCIFLHYTSLWSSAQLSTVMPTAGLLTAHLCTSCLKGSLCVFHSHSSITQSVISHRSRRPADLKYVYVLHWLIKKMKKIGPKNA